MKCTPSSIYNCKKILLESIIITIISILNFVIWSKVRWQDVKFNLTDMNIPRSISMKKIYYSTHMNIKFLPGELLGTEKSMVFLLAMN